MVSSWKTFRGKAAITVEPPRVKEIKVCFLVILGAFLGPAPREQEPFRAGDQIFDSEQLSSFA